MPFAELTNFPIHTILIRLEIAEAELAIASYGQLQIVVASG